MNAQQAMYEFVTGLIGAIANPDGIWLIAGPLVLLNVVLLVIRWSRNSATGERMDNLTQGYQETREGYQRAGRRIRDIRRRP